MRSIASLPNRSSDLRNIACSIAIVQFLGAKVLLFLGLLLIRSVFLYLFSFIFNLFEAFNDVLNVGLVSIIFDGDSLGLAGIQKAMRRTQKP
jgi:hypothetical protein